MPRKSNGRKSILPTSERFKTNITNGLSASQKKDRLKEIEALADKEMPLEEALKLGAEYLELEAES